MLITGKIEEVRNFIKHTSGKSGQIGFVPTMGALHQGHISLINKACVDNDLVVSSIFVNPSQFHDKMDLVNYPRTPESDHLLLEEAGCDLLFEPDVSEMYPTEHLLDIDFGDLEHIMEGKFRPGHFKGVATVVSRFFEIIQPDRAYFGEKDFQQLAVINELNRIMNHGIEIIGCPTLRESDGLAMSSRNIHLTKEERKAAPIIYHALCFASDNIPEMGPAVTAKNVIKMIERSGVFKVQYLEFVDSLTLQPILKYDPAKSQRVCIAVLTSSTRLIDNRAI